MGFVDAAKRTPLHALLLDAVTPAAVDEGAHADARAAAESAIEDTNAFALEAVGPAVTAWDDAAKVRLALPVNDLVGSFGYEGGFFLEERADDLHVLLNLVASFAPTTGEASLDGVTVVEDFVACGADVFAVAIDPAQASRDGDAVTFAGAGVDVADVTIDELVVDGATWWCVR